MAVERRSYFSDSVAATNRIRGGAPRSLLPSSKEWQDEERRIYASEARASSASPATRAAACCPAPPSHARSLGGSPVAVSPARLEPPETPAQSFVPLAAQLSGQTSRATKLLPWERFAPRSSAEVFGQDLAKEKVFAWLRSARAPSTLFATALVLQGPSGVGKSCLARCAIAEAGYATVEFGPHMEIPLGSFLRRLGSVDSEGQKICLLVEDLPQVMELKGNECAGSARVHFPVLCTADFVSKRNQSNYGSVASLFRLRGSDMRTILARRLAPSLGLQPQAFDALLDAARGDARQLCLHATFLSGLLRRTACSRDAIRSPWEQARVLLGVRERQWHAAISEEEVTPLAYWLLHENFNRIDELSIISAARFAEDMAVIDIIDASTPAAAHAGNLAALACIVRRGDAKMGETKLVEFAGVVAERKRSSTHDALILLRASMKAARAPLLQLALRGVNIPPTMKRPRSE